MNKKTRPSAAWLVLLILILLFAAREIALSMRSGVASQAFSQKQERSTPAGPVLTFADVIDEFGKPVHFVSWKGQLDEYHLYIYPLPNAEYKVLFNSDLDVCSIEVTKYTRHESEYTVVEYKPQLVSDARSAN
jgi:hypothetical protein